MMTALVVSSTVGGLAYSLGHRRGRTQSLKTQSSNRDKDLGGDLDGTLLLVSSNLLVPDRPSDASELDSQEHSQFPKATSPSALERNVLDTTPLAKIDIVAELIEDLHSPDPSKRRQAIWNLGQHGDSRALLPLVDLMKDSDSGQRSLILAAVAEIGTKILKPVNRALLLSLQDRSSDVRKNGIRDVTRIYDSVGQVSQLLQHAASDPNQEVQETALWALTQLDRIHPLSGLDGLQRIPNRLSLKELETGKKGRGTELTGYERF
jgi:HEAT repeats